jgi:hypothetical protein
MPGTRDHAPLVIEDFAGWWRRGDPESAPSNHFIQGDNIQFFHSGVETRDGLTNYMVNPLPTLKFLRIYNYVTQEGQTIIGMVEGGKIYHIKGPNGPVLGPILTIPAMEDFGFVAINGRAYITPFKTYTNAQGEKYQLGIQNEFLYVYNGDGSQARKAGGPPPSGAALGVTQSALDGATDVGFHLVAVVYETDSGYLTALGPEVFGSLTFDGVHQITVSPLPISPSVNVKKRHIVATKWIPEYNGDQKGYQFFFIPGAVVPDNTTTTWTGQFYDSDLISDASHLIDNFSEIPAGVTLNTYHSRLVIVGEFGTTETLTGLPTGITDNRSIARLSNPGEPESISKIDGLLIAPLDGHALTNVQEFRDILYLFKKTRTYAYSDNYDVPSSWQEEILDQGIGAPVHGIAKVLDTGGVNIDFLLIADWSGLMQFNGTYAQPELSWKIEDFWRSINRNEFHDIQMVNDSINKKIWITLPDPNRTYILHADYNNGMNAKDIRWSRWVFNVRAFTIALIETDRLVIGTPGPEFQEVLDVRDR